MKDLISRQAVLKTLDNMDNVLDVDRTIENYKELLKECYEVLPPVNPQKKTGHWTALEEWKNDFKGFINELSMPKDDYNGIMEYIDEVPTEFLL